MDSIRKQMRAVGEDSQVAAEISRKRFVPWQQRGQAFSSYLMKGSCPNPVFSNHEVVVVQSGANAV